MVKLQDSNNCFVCGNDNPQGLHVRYEIDEAAKTIRGVYRARAEHEGYNRIIHGGVISAIMDEAMVKLAWKLGMPAVSAEITVKFKSPAAPGDELIVSAWLTKTANRLIEVESKVERGPVVISEAKGKLLRTA